MPRLRGDAYRRYDIVGISLVLRLLRDSAATGTIEHSAYNAPMPDSADFYSRLPITASFAGVMDPARYDPLRDDWLIGLTDVQGSTAAIEQGRYKTVNAAGASVIS